METTQTKNCRIEGCKDPYRAKGYCESHYKKWRRGELPHPRYKTCVMDGCRKKRATGSLCEEHAKTTSAKAPAHEAPVQEAKEPAKS